MEQIASECHMHNTVSSIRRNFVKAVAMHVGMK